MMQKARARRRRPWTRDELRVLKKASRERRPVQQISREMRRSKGALRWKAWQLQLPLGQHQHR